LEGFIMIRRVRPPRHPERGQSLVEYALVLILVAVVVIVIAAIFGDSVRKTYCQVLYTIAPESDAPGCEGLTVTCATLDIGSGYANIQANVSSFDLEINDDTIDVDWYVDDGFVRTEIADPYCLGSNTTGQPCRDHSLSPGDHTITAIARHTEGETGQCTIDITVP
jgi:Flp pilus assembly pilin Flp